MKKLLLIALTSLSIHVIAQTNTFPLDGNVGIGTTTPLSNLEVANSSGGVLSISTNKINGSSTSPLRPAIDFLGYANGNKARISATEQTYDTHGSQLSMFVNDGSGSTSLVERLTINMYGNVGIGTTSPLGKLHIEAGYPSIYITSTGSNPSAALRGNNGTWLFGYNNAIGMEDISIGTQDGTGQRTITLATGGFAKIKILANGNTGIGTTNPAYKLDVLGTIRAKEVLINLDGGADFVFEKDYKLPAIEHVANYVQEHKHLPDIPSAKEMEKNGVSMGDMQVKLLQKVEELTLYAIQQNKMIEQQNKKIEQLENSIKHIR